MMKPIGTLTFTLSLSLTLLTACSASPGAGENSASGGQAATAEEITACDVDDDCVAIDRGGCCSHGWLTAVNASEVEAYDALHTCEVATICPHYVVHDTRKASCNAETKSCEMIQADTDEPAGDSTASK